MGKSAILKKIHNAAKNYQRYLAGKTFMYVYEGKSIEVVFKNSSFSFATVLPLTYRKIVSIVS